MAEILRLEWRKDSSGYRAIERAGEPSPEGAALLSGVGSQLPGTYIVGQGGPPERYVLNGEDGITVLLALANTPQTEEGVLGFVNRWGLLNTYSEPAISEINRAVDQLENALLHCASGELSELHQWMSTRSYWPSRVRIATNGTRYREPSSLAGFCWLSFLDAIDDGRRFGICEYCRDFYAAIRGKLRRFCEGGCRQIAHKKGLASAKGPTGKQPS